MHVIVIGAGVAGLTTAWLLQQEGLRVTVLERAGAAGQGASRGNGAQLSYSYVAPLAEPAVVGKLPTLLADEDSPLKFHFQFDPLQWRWGLAFLRACRFEQAQATTRALLALAALSRGVTEQVIGEARIDCAFAHSGKLVLYPDAAALATAQAQLQFQAGLGCEQHLLDRVGADGNLTHFWGSCRPKTDPGVQPTLPDLSTAGRGVRSDHHGHDWQGLADATPREEVGAGDRQGDEPGEEHGAQVPAPWQGRGAEVQAARGAGQVGTVRGGGAAGAAG